MNNDDLKNLGTDYKYGFTTDVKNVFDTGRGISEEVVRTISKMKNEPSWMEEIRVKAYKEFEKKNWPTFGPYIKDLNFDEYENKDVSEIKNAIDFFDTVYADIYNYSIKFDKNEI